MTAPTRPVLRWHGGKWKLAPWIISHFPRHRIYVEPFGGAASVLLQKPRCYAEVYNDLDADLINLFRVLRSPAAADALLTALRLTPFGRDEFKACYAPSTDPVERARRMIARSFMGHGSGAVFCRPTGFRANANASGAHNTAAEWGGYPECLVAIIERLKGVVIENRPAPDVMTAADSAETLHYVDPPYVPATRSDRSRKGGTLYHAYAHEMTDDDHRALLDALRRLTGYVVLSGYPSALYDDALGDWRRVTTSALADGARERTEVLWINPAGASALDAETRQGVLFA
jgi:DNA adenine methylase